MLGSGRVEGKKVSRWPTDGPGPAWSREQTFSGDPWRSLLIAAGVSLAYWGISWLNWALFKRGGILPMPIWPAAGFAVAAVYRFGWRAVPGLYLGALLANAVTLGSGWGLAAIIGIANALGPWLAVHVIRSRTENRAPFQTVGDFAIFVLLAVVVHPALTATGGIGGRLLLGDIAAGAFLERWQHWWLGHATGTILFAPVLLLWMAPRRESGRQAGDKEYWVLIALTVLAATGLFFYSNAFPLGLPYLLIVPMAWAAIRHSMLRTMALYIVVVLVGIGAMVWVPALKPGDSWAIMFPFRTMAIAYSSILLLLAIMRNIQLATEETLHAKADELAAHRRHLEERVAERTLQLARAKEAAEAANRAKSVFLANVTHELRTPLNAILGFAALLRRDAGIADGHRAQLDIIDRSGQQLLALIDDALDMARIETGRVTVETAPFDLAGLIRDLADLTRARAEEKGLRLAVDLSPEAPRYVRGDQIRLRQALLNLLDNAVKFTDKGHVVLRLRAVPDEGRVRLAFEVEDTGRGIAMEDRARIFEPFVQIGEAAAQQGTGLGLAIGRQFVEMMGGRIDVTGQLGKGSRFRVELSVEPAAEAEMTGRRDSGEVVGLASGQPAYRIMIVEARPGSASSLARSLEAAGFPVRVAESGSRAIEAFERWRPHLVWMDRQVPVPATKETVERIRASEGGRRAKIVALADPTLAEQRNELLGAGVDEVLREPARPGEIFECMARHLGVRYAYREIGASAEAAVEPDEPSSARTLVVALPDDLRQRLLDAAVILDAGRVAALIGRVAERDPALGQLLRRHADNFDYGAILNLLAPAQKAGLAE